MRLLVKDRVNLGAIASNMPLYCGWYIDNLFFISFLNTWKTSSFLFSSCAKHPAPLLSGVILKHTMFAFSGLIVGQPEIRHLQILLWFCICILKWHVLLCDSVFRFVFFPSPQAFYFFFLFCATSHFCRNMAGKMFTSWFSRGLSKPALS